MTSTYHVLQSARLLQDEQGLILSNDSTPLHATAQTFGRLGQWYASFVSSCLQWQNKARYTIALDGTCFAMHLMLLRQLWQNDSQRCRRLHLLVFEENPLSREDFYRMAAVLYPAQWQAALNELGSHWPCVLPGVHRIDLAQGNVTITLLYGDRHKMLKNVHASIDAYILADGCRQPETGTGNYEDWLRYASPAVSVLAYAQDESALRQALKTEGLVVRETRFNLANKTKYLHVQAQSGRPMPVYAADHDKTALVIGGGLAGAGVAHALALGGWRVKIFDPAFAYAGSAGQRGHIAAALTPLISVDDNFKSRLSRAGTLRAHARWRDFPASAIPARCGTLELSRDKGHARDLADAIEIMQFPREWCRNVSQNEAAALAGMALDRSGAYFSAGILVNPEGLIETLLENEAIERVAASVAFLLEKENGQWELLAADGVTVASGQTVVVAAGLQTLPILKKSGLLQKTLRSGAQVQAIPKMNTLHPMGGEVMHVPAGQVGGGPRCVIGGEGYFLPAVNGMCVMGSTYVHNQAIPGVSRKGQETILKKMPFLPNDSLKKAVQNNEITGWAGMRAVMQGRLPVIGQLNHAKGVWVAAAYASHGLTWSSLAGDVIGAMLEGEPVPLERDLLKAIAPR